MCYNFVVDRIQPADGDFKFLVSGKAGIFLPSPVLLNNFPWFHDFLKSQQNFSMGLRRIDPLFVSQLESLVSGQVPSNRNIDKQIQKTGAGFGDSETNRQVEQAAIASVVNDYQERGWSVKSISSEKRGYDLLCTKAATKEHVEVKGIQGDLVSFIITNGEVKQSQSDEKFVLYAVTSALSNPRLHRFTGSELREKFSLEAVSYRASLKRG